MIRLMLINLFLFLLPFALSWAWSAWLARHRPNVETRRSLARSALIGAGLVLLSLIVLRVSGSNAPSKDYVPPRYENGKILPGRFE